MKDVVLNALRMFGLDREVALFHRAFAKVPAHRFAVIKLSGKTLEAMSNAIAEDLAFLSSLGLTPIVVHGAGSQIDRELQKRGIPIEKVNGLRLTDERTMAVVQNVLNGVSAKLVASINKKGGRAVNANGLNLVHASKLLPVSGRDLGRVGQVDSIDAAELRSLCQSGVIPVLASMAKGSDGWYNVNADTLSRQVVRHIKPQKFILITSTGGILDASGKIISTIDVQRELPQMLQSGLITEGMKVKVGEIKRLLDEVPQTVVEICAPDKLLQELFTIKGSGTLLRSGANLVSARSFRSLNSSAIRQLLEESFGKKLVADYFRQSVELVLLEKSYAGVAIVKTLNGEHYLDKFAIRQKAQSTGLSKIIWQEIKRAYPQLIWRSSVNNPVNPWYLKQADGAHKQGGWIVFWYGTKPSAATIQNVLNLPKTMVSA
ncbi:acetylglutamate kinase [Candidatus Micrarchaeota archaeon]|nr:acetylglutamate kinase [Candidatus Micrarchaeota archaeon]